MVKEQLLGASNKFFYYVMSGGATFNIRLTFTVNNLQVDVLKQSFEDALKRYPELSVKPVIKGNALSSVLISEPLVVAPKGQKALHFGTKDTNGYMFYLSYEADSFTVSYYHGLTDVVGMVEYVRCAMYLYATRTGFEFNEDELKELLASIREDEKYYEKNMSQDLLDPYNAHKNEAAVPDYEYDGRTAFSIPATTYEDDVYYYHECEITLKTSEFLAMSKKLGVSAAPLILDITSGAIRKEYAAGDLPVTAMLPVNFRPYVGSKTVVNCSDSVFIPYHSEDEELNVEERCAKWKEYITKQVNLGNLTKQMAGKAGNVEMFEKDEMPILDRVGLMTKVLPKDAKRPLSYAMTYPGKMTLLSGLDRFLVNYELKGWARANAVVGYSFRDELHFMVLCRTDDNRLANCILNEFRDRGLEASMVDNKRVYPDLVLVKELERLEN
ncbi:MAG: hypothetical protein KBS85_00570 [Lachnospiraceae bacterium]|nr:hypothetical protein [Candidatus Merdinaster equi]